MIRVLMRRRHHRLLIAVSSFGESLRWVFLTIPAEAIFKPLSAAIASRLQRLIGHGQHHNERRAFAGCAFHPNPPLVIFDN